MTALSAINAAGEGLDILGAWEDENAMDAAAMCTFLPQVPRSLYAALANLAEVFQDGPYHKPIADILADMAQGAAIMADYADELGPLFESLHEDQLDRLRHPRPGAHKWDISENP